MSNTFSSNIVFLVDTNFLNCVDTIEYTFSSKILEFADINYGKIKYDEFNLCSENKIFFDNSIVYYYIACEKVNSLVDYIWKHDNSIYCCHIIIVHESNQQKEDKLLKINYNEILKRATKNGILVSCVILDETSINNFLNFILSNDSVEIFENNKVIHLENFYKNNIFLNKKEIIFKKFFNLSCSEILCNYDKTNFIELPKDSNNLLSLLNVDKKYGSLPSSVYKSMVYYGLKSDNLNMVVNYYFDKIYVLCLHGRQNKTEKQLLKHEITNYKLFEGLYGKKSVLCKNEYENYAKKFPVLLNEKQVLNGKKRRAISSVGSWAILKSMYNMITDAKTHNYNRILLLQDDTIFHNNFFNVFKEKVMSIPNSWKLLYLGASEYDWSNVKIIDKNYYNAVGKTDGAFAVGIHNSIYDELLESITEFNVPFDSGPLWNIQKKYSKYCYVVYNNIIIADVRSSDLRKSRNIYNTANMFKWDLKYFDLT